MCFGGPLSGFCARHVFGQRHGFRDAVQSPSEAFESHINSAMERRGLGIPDPRSRIPLVHRRDKGSATRGSGPLCRWVGHRSRRFHLKVSVRSRWFQSVIMFSQSGMGSDPSRQPCSLQDRKIHTGPPAPRLRWQSIGAARAEDDSSRGEGGRPAPQIQVPEDLLHDLGRVDDSHHSHRSLAGGTLQRVRKPCLWDEVTSVA